MPTRLDILKSSLAKKVALFDSKLNNHFETVRQSNGQPLNDKRNGQATLNKWERQNSALRNINEGIEKTKRAIEAEEGKLKGLSHVKETLPALVLEMLESGDLIQWKKHPTTFFVNGVDRARIVWDAKKRIISHRYSREVTDKEQWSLFAKTFNKILNDLKSKL